MLSWPNATAMRRWNSWCLWSGRRQGTVLPSTVKTTVRAQVLDPLDGSRLRDRVSDVDVDVLDEVGVNR